MPLKTSLVVARADKLVASAGLRDPKKLASELGVDILPRSFKYQKGAYMLIARQPFIFIKSDLGPVMEPIVLAHELGHHCLHRREAQILGGFREFNIFNMQNDRMEYEANVFASELLLPDCEVLEYVDQGWDIHRIASAMMSDVNLVALKIDTLISRGWRLTKQPHSTKFLAPPD